LNGTQIDTWSGSLNVTPFPSSPNVKIQSVTLPANAKISSGFIVTNYSTVFRLINNESIDVPISWLAHSSLTGNFGSGSVTVPKNSYADVSKGYHYSTPGILTITYTTFYNGVQLDSWKGTMNVAPP
jgi:hypothetical protein